MVVVVVWHFRPGATWRNVSDTSLPLSKSGLLLVLDLQWHKFCNYFKITVARLVQWWHSGTVGTAWHSCIVLAQWWHKLQILSDHVPCPLSIPRQVADPQTPLCKHGLILDT